MSLLYLVLLALQLILFSYYLTNSLSIQLPNYSFFDGVAIYFNTYKKIELLQYMLSIIILGLYFLSIILIDKHTNTTHKRYFQQRLSFLLKNKATSIQLMATSFIIPFLIYKTVDPFDSKLLFQCINILIFILLPFAKIAKECLLNRPFTIWSMSLSKLPIVLLLFISYLQLVSIFYDPIFQKPKIINEYFNIPEKTLINHTYIDNTLFFTENLSSSITHKSDVTKELVESNCINAKPSDLNIFTPSLHDTTFYYNVDKNITCINGLLDTKIFNSLNNQDMYFLLQSLQEASIMQDRYIRDSNFSRFLKYNKFEIHWQTLSRFMIHHNSFVFIPVGELHDGKDIKTINAQYGLGNIYLFNYILNALDDISFDNILRINYISYLLYFALFIFILYEITQKIELTLFSFLTCLAYINFRGYDFLILPPGESPWRHLFDIVILYCLYQFGEKKYKRYWILALLLGLVSIFMNPQIGLMIFIAALVSGIFYVLYEKREVAFHGLTIGMGIFLAGLIYSQVSSSNDLSQYYIDGVIGFPISFVSMFKILLIIIIGYFLLWKLIRDRNCTNYLYLIFLFIYSQELIVYVVWHFDINGFKSRAFIYILTIILLLYNLQYAITEKIKTYVVTAAIGVAVLLYTSSVFKLYKSKDSYETIFKTHETYEWDFERAKILSTMNPSYFKEAINLLNQYSKDNNGIFILSEYDNFIPFLAKKYSLMPFFDLKWYLLTPKELEKCKALVHTAKPEYLYVDTHIDRNLNNEIIDTKFPKISYLNQESIWRVQRLKLLNEIFQAVKNDYELTQSSPLISVYKRKNIK